MSDLYRPHPFRARDYPCRGQDYLGRRRDSLGSLRFLCNYLRGGSTDLLGCTVVIRRFYCHQNRWPWRGGVCDIELEDVNRSRVNACRRFGVVSWKYTFLRPEWIDRQCASRIVELRRSDCEEKLVQGLLKGNIPPRTDRPDQANQTYFVNPERHLEVCSQRHSKGVRLACHYAALIKAAQQKLRSIHLQNTPPVRPKLSLSTVSLALHFTRFCSRQEFAQVKCLPACICKLDPIFLVRTSDMGKMRHQIWSALFG